MAGKSDPDLEDRVASLERQVNSLWQAIGKESEDRDVVAALARMTPRMHGALQCILAGASNREIAKRFGVQESTAKVYVRGVAAKLGVKSRAEILSKVMTTMKAMQQGEYEKLAKISRYWFESGEPWSDRDGEQT